MSEQNKTIKEKLEDLKSKLDWFNGEDFEVEESIEKYEEAKKVAEEIIKDLGNKKNELKEL